MTDANDLLERRAERGEHRGADAIAAAAVAAAPGAPRRRPSPMLAVAAVAAIALVAAAVALTRPDHHPARVTTSGIARSGWPATAPAPIGGRANPATATDGRRLFVWGGYDFGGRDGQPRELADGALYDPAADRWERVPAAPQPLVGATGAAVWDGARFVVVAGSFDAHTIGAAAYDPATHAWTRLPQPPFGYREGFALTSSGDDVYVTGGGAGDTIADDFGAVYHRATNTWDLLPQPPYPHWVPLASLWDHTALVLIGGSSSVGGTSADPQTPVPGAAYTPGAGWTRLPDVPPRAETFVHTDAGIVAIGGSARELSTSLLTSDHRSWIGGALIPGLDEPIRTIETGHNGWITLTTHGAVLYDTAGNPTPLPDVDLTNRGGRTQFAGGVVGDWLVVWGGLHDTSTKDSVRSDGVRFNLRNAFQGGGESTGASAPPSLSVLHGELVRGVPVTVVFRGLESLRGQEVDITIRTPDPVSLPNRSPVIGSFGVDSVVVDGRGTAEAQFTVPNQLSGQDDIVPIRPGDPYFVDIAGRRGGAAPVSIPIVFEAARTGAFYAITARRGPAECGAPPLEIDFDGSMWVPDQPERFPPDPSFPGTLELTGASSARFVSGSLTATFHRSATGYSCV